VELIYTYASVQAKQGATTKSATASDQTLLDQPATGYLINKDDIAFRGYMSLLDVLRDVPEIELNENTDPDYLNIVSSRGVSGTGRWLIMQDGIRINNMLGSDIVLTQNISVRGYQHH
jgi:outer membrane receptor for ferrienterochelin and colicin